MVLSPNDEEVANSSKNMPNSRLERTNHTLFQTKMVEIDTLFQTKTAKKPYPLARPGADYWRGTYLYSLCKGLSPLPGLATHQLQAYLKSWWNSKKKFANHGFYINGYVSVSIHQGKCCG